MSLRLLDECLRMPAFRPQLRFAEVEDAVKHRDRRERDEMLSNAGRMDNERQRIARQERGDLARKDELESSIADLKRQLKVESKQIELRKSLVKRIQQTSLMETALSRAALSERDRLVEEVLGLHSKLRDLEKETDLLTQSLSKIIRSREAKEEQEQARKRQRVDSDKMVKMKSERAALRRLFFALIMESGTDWLNDEDLRKIVWSIR